MTQQDRRMEDPSSVPEKNQTVPEAKEKDLLHEGKDEAWLDVDRMINEGLGGGQVGEGGGEIEGSRPLTDEDPPGESEEGV